MVVFRQDGHLSVRRIELDLMHRPHELARVHAAHPLQGAREQVHLAVAGFGIDAGRMFAEALAPARQEMLVGGRIDGIEIGGGGDVAHAALRPDLGDLGLRHGQAGDGNVGRPRPRLLAGLVVALVEALRVRTDQRGEDHIGLDAADVRHDVDDVAFVAAQGQIGFVQDLAAVLLHGLAHDAVRLTRVDVVRPHQENARSAVLDQVGGQLHAALIGRRAGVDDVGRILEALVHRAVPQQGIGALHHRQHRLAAMRGAAAEDDADFVVQQQAGRQAPVFLGIATRVVHHRFQRPAQHAAQGVDLFHGQHRPEEMLRLGRARHAAARIEHADAPAGPFCVLVLERGHDDVLERESWVPAREETEMAAFIP
ncbi:hypothetical protein G6F22_014130 [Rhizopus arrhizus]|nr:hypothetical protein G6F22_014130 [Rhizopus arrhizus]